MGFNCLKATATWRRQFSFYHSVPRNSWYSFYRPRKDERLSRSWSHPVVLNTGPPDWESSALTNRPLLHKFTILNLRWSSSMNNTTKISLVFNILPTCSDKNTTKNGTTRSLIPCTYPLAGWRIAQINRILSNN